MQAANLLYSIMCMRVTPTIEGVGQGGAIITAALPEMGYVEDGSIRPFIGLPSGQLFLRSHWIGRHQEGRFCTHVLWTELKDGTTTC